MAKFMGCEMKSHRSSHLPGMSLRERRSKQRERRSKQQERRSKQSPFTISVTHGKLFAFFLFAFILSGCNLLGGPKYPTLIPTEYVPTAIALTVEAGRRSVLTAPVPMASANTQKIKATPQDTPTGPGVSATPIAGISPFDATLSSTAGLPAPAASPTPAPNTVAETATSSLPATVETTPTARPTPSPSPTYRYRRTPTPTETPGIPNATILIYNPGPMSKLTSPIQLSASLQPGPSGSVVITLIGENGNILYRKLLRYTTHDWVAISENVEFSISAAAEAARLQISTEDENNRVMSLASVDLLLLSIGEDDLNPPADLLEQLILREPLPNTLIQGGKVTVTGLARTGGEQPLLIELVDTNGTVVGYRQAAVTPPADPWSTQGYGTFQIEVPYTVEGPTWVRLDVSSFEDRIPGPTHLSSTVILLGP